MPEMTGTVRCLQIADDYGFITLEDADGEKETFILWWAPGTGGGIPSDATSFTRIMHSMWVSLIREARSTNSTITVGHPTGSAAVTYLQWGVF